MTSTNVVGILGGMGPAAGADFARLFVDSCTDVMRAMDVAVTDQAYPEHWLAQVPKCPSPTAPRRCSSAAAAQTRRWNP